MIDLTINTKKLEKAVQRCRERDVIIPTFKEQKNPDLIPDRIKNTLKTIGLWDFNSYNLFRITWKNEPVPRGGLFDGVNYLELPRELTGVDARIICLVGKWFPTGAHKVGASFGCLVPRLVTGQFDPTSQKAVWPSTGNYCRGGAYDSHLLGCESIAILPEGMSTERFEWLKKVAGEVIATPGCESNVKEIYDKCWELRESRKESIVIFNQFDEMGNHLWHYEITGHAMEEVLKKEMRKDDRYAGVVLTTGSAGTIGCGDYLKKIFPTSTIAAGEAWQCPTLLLNGFGGHRIEGIGDKHVPWVHNVRNTDAVAAIDDEDCMRLLRLFNEPAGRAHLATLGVEARAVDRLPWLGISGIGNLLAAIKTAKFFELDERDVIFTVFTDSMELYRSRLTELRAERGEYRAADAIADQAGPLAHQGIEHFKELGYQDRKAIHNLKYFTWVEQQGKTSQELAEQWEPDYWHRLCEEEVGHFDELIEAFNAAIGAPG